MNFSFHCILAVEFYLALLYGFHLFIDSLYLFPPYTHVLFSTFEHEHSYNTVFQGPCLLTPLNHLCTFWFYFYLLIFLLIMGHVVLLLCMSTKFLLDPRYCECCVCEGLDVLSFLEVC